MLLGQMISSAGKCTYAGIDELNGILFESAEKLYCDIAPEIKKCIIPSNPLDKTLVITFGIGLFGYALAPSKEMIETLGVLASFYAGLSPARYGEASNGKENDKKQKK